MEKFIIQGGKKISGEIDVKGAKNAALKIVPASILSEEKITITNLPEIEDIKRSIEMMEHLGAEITLSKSSCEIQLKDIKTIELSSELANKFRASIMFVAPILARFGEVKFPHPGGCVIGAGSRPIDLFLEGFLALGAKIEHKDGFYHIKASKLKACDYFFTTVSVTGTESIMMAATLADGVSVIKNCAMEPEITALAEYLNTQGAKISGAGTPIMSIEGVDKLSAGTFEVIPDRIETGTFAILAALTKAELTIKKCNPNHIEILLNIFNKIGIRFDAGIDYLRIFPTESFKSYSIKTHEYPGFPTDLQSPYTLLMTQAQGSSLIHETIYDRRLLFTDLLAQMGANSIMCDPHRIVVNGPTPLFGKKLTSPDLRAGITMILAGLIAEGETTIDNIYQIDRGYEKIDERLRTLGADIKRVKD
ncbi:MAG: UDP-N-acetylglucosamine 1-carboxyvinyltransferase [Patescibacteria group bacterium]|jgi:UDP-N-acetylglucosamine 1-carboxyvinyltransferase|nr:UDP-N-acetylglucosamine 1-carboxyvinyltransferase [Patescibacteria group bacterium]